MSQKKVDAYKAQKANRVKNAKKEKLQYRIETGIGALIAIVIVGWMGFSVYDKATTNPFKNVHPFTLVWSEDDIKNSHLDCYKFIKLVCV